MCTTWAAAAVEVLRAQAQAYRVLETVVSKKRVIQLRETKRFVPFGKWSEL